MYQITAKGPRGPIETAWEALAWADPSPAGAVDAKEDSRGAWRLDAFAETLDDAEACVALIEDTVPELTAGIKEIVERDWVPLATAVAGALLFANAFALIWMLTTRFTGMLVLGFGDVRLAAVLGLLLGWYGLPFVLYGALAGHLLALVIAVATCIRKRGLHLRYSFGPPLIAGTLAVVLIHG